MIAAAVRALTRALLRLRYRIRVTGLEAGAAGVVTAGGAETTGAGTTGAVTTGGVVTTGLPVDGDEPDGTVGAVTGDWMPYWLAVDGATAMTAGA